MLSKKERLKQYGVGHDVELMGSISKACSIFGNGVNKNADLNMEKCARAESHFANYPDNSKKYGESAFQFDRKTFDWVKTKILRDVRYKDEYLLILKYYSVKLGDFYYEQLRHNADIAAALCRIRYKFVPDVFPSTDYEQWEYYKKHWNSSKGKGNYEHWKELTKNCYFD